MDQKELSRHETKDDGDSGRPGLEVKRCVSGKEWIGEWEEEGGGGRREVGPSQGRTRHRRRESFGVAHLSERITVG